MIVNRRAFLLLAGTALAVPPAFAADSADVIYSGGPVLTMDDANPRAEAVAVKDGRILAVGSTADVMTLKGDGTRLVDLRGRALLPGFVDGHSHIVMGGLQALSANLLPPPDGPTAEIVDVQTILRDWVKANEQIVSKVNLIVGFGYDNSQLKELRHPTRDDLDAVSKDIPIIVVHQSTHLGALNSKALEVAGISAETADPVGGVIQRRPGSREPNGVLEESALIFAAPKLLQNLGQDGLKAMAEAGSDLWASFGYTTVQEGRSVPAICRVLEAVAAEGKFKVDVVAYPDALVDRDFIKAKASRTYANRYRVGGAKLSIDGAPQGFTAWRDRPYYAPVGDYPPGYLGYAAAPPETFIETIDWAYANGIQTITHANGEAASDLLIAAHSSAQAKHGGGDRRHVLIHGQFEREDQVDSYVRLGIFPSLFPMHTFYWGDWHRDHTVGPELADNISPTGWYVKRGSKFSSHHDAPVAFPNAMRILDATVTRRSRSGDIIGPAQRTTVMEALKALTLWAAYQHFEDGEKGSIQVGKLADLVILSADPTAVDPETLDQLQVVETVKEGRSVYTQGQKKADLTGQSDSLNTALYGLFKEIHIQFELERLPESYRTAEVRRRIAESYEDCAASLLLPRLFGLDEDRQKTAHGGSGAVAAPN